MITPNILNFLYFYFSKKNQKMGLDNIPYFSTRKKASQVRLMASSTALFFSFSKLAYSYLEKLASLEVSVYRREDMTVTVNIAGSPTSKLMVNTNVSPGNKGV
jgi:hypothetical protein